MTTFDVAIVGAGPGGYVCALRCAQLGLEVAVIESSAVGGTCLNWGCIPTKSLLDSAHAVTLAHHLSDFGVDVGPGPITADYAIAHSRSRAAVSQLTRGVTGLLQRANVTVIEGTGVLVPGGVQVGDEFVEAPDVVVATGARPRPLPNTTFNGSEIMSYRDVLALNEAPESLVIVGAGPIGLEFASVFAAYGTAVTVIEAGDTILPGEDTDVSTGLAKALKKHGIVVQTGTLVKEIAMTAGGVEVHHDGIDGPGHSQAAACLVAIGIQANTDGLGLEAMGVETANGFIAVDDRLATSVSGIWAIGDVAGRLPLAHVASAEGVSVAESIADANPHTINYRHVPRCVYTDPQVAAVGLTEAQAVDANYSPSVGSFPLTANGRAIAAGSTAGFAKVVADNATGELLGVHLVGPVASEMIVGAAALLGLEATLDELSATIHPHPTYSEAIAEAALAASGEPLHV